MLSAARQLARDMRSQKLRTLLTLFGIVWGTVAVSLLLAFGDALHRQPLKTSAGMGSGVIVGWPSLTSLPWEGLGKGRRIRLTDDDIRLVRKKVIGLGHVSAEYEQSIKMQLGPKVLSVAVSGVEPDFARIRNLIPQAGGRFLDPIDERGKRRVAFIGDELAGQLFGSSDPVGQTIRLQGSPFLIVGVMNPKIQDSSYSGRDKGKLFVPASTMRAMTGQRYVDNFVFTSVDVTRTEPVKDQVLRTLAARHRFDPEDRDALSFWDTTEAKRFLDTFMLAFRIFLGVLGFLTLVVGGIGVSNIMNVVVEERTREIGIKMALGARPRGILLQFLAETFVLTTAGGLFGILITVGICAAFSTFGLTDFVGEPAVSADIAVGTAALLGLIGFVSGYFPARTAANLDPVVAMKM